MARSRVTAIPLTIRVVETPIGNFFGYDERDGQTVNRMVRHLSPQSAGCRGELWSVIRDGKIVATGRMLETRGDMVLHWSEGGGPFQRQGYSNLSAEDFKSGDIIFVDPDPTNGLAAPFFDRIYWSRLAVDGYYYGAQLYLPKDDEGR